MDDRLKKAQAERRTALVRFTNAGREPWSPWFVSGSSKLMNVSKEDKLNFEIHMATRRTRFNPHESLLVRVLLPKPLAEYPADVALCVGFKDKESQYARYATSPLLPDE